MFYYNFHFDNTVISHLSAVLVISLDPSVSSLQQIDKAQQCFILFIGQACIHIVKRWKKKRKRKLQSC